MLLFIAWILISYIKVTTTIWMLSTRQLPVADDEIAVGAYNGTIFLLGGYQSTTQLTQYEIATDTLIDLGVDALTNDIGGYGQYWTQIDHIVYMIDTNNPHFNIYNMITQEYTTNWKSITFNTNVEHHGCLASSSQHLFVTGGYSGSIFHNELQILTLSTHEWINNAPSMNEPERASHACVVHNDYLWVFGGYNGEYNVYPIKTNERISTVDIIHNIWVFINPLTVALSFLRSVSWYDIIYVIGGYDGWEDHDIVHLVDANTGTVSVSPDKLPLRNSYGSPIIVDAVLYVFGGFQDNGNTAADWAYYPLEPHREVTSTSTSNPSLLPSYNPSLSNNPSLSPSNNPSLTPSLHPHILTSINATISPSDDEYLTSTNDKQTNTTPTVTLRIYQTTNTRYTSTVQITVEETQDTQHQNDRKAPNHQKIVYITVFGVILLVFVILVSIYYRKNIVEKRKISEKDVEIVENASAEDDIAYAVKGPYEKQQNNEDSEGVTIGGNINNEMDRRLTNKLEEGRTDDVVQNVCMTRKAMIEDKILLGIISTKGGDIDSNVMSKKTVTAATDDDNVDTVATDGCHNI